MEEKEDELVDQEKYFIIIMHLLLGVAHRSWGVVIHRLGPPIFESKRGL